MAFGSLTYEVRGAPRWNTFVAGLGIDIAAVLLMITVGARVTTQVLPRPTASTYHVTLIAPVSSPPPPAPQRMIPISLQEIAKVETAKLPPTPAMRITPPQPQRVEPQKTELPKIAAAVMPANPTVPTSRKQEVKTNVFDAAKSDTATVHQPARAVQTGGFGDPNGISGQGDPKRPTVTVARVGSFDLPLGPGNGNGTGGVHGVSGTVRASGFGAAVASPVPHGHGNGGVMPSGFGEVIAQGGGSPQQPLRKKPDLQPVEIVYKPRPLYTPEARQLRLQGEVLLEVVFTASGWLHVNRVVRGLGHGLDDAALAAAQRIQFHPARRDGQPYDCAALVHMVFELAD